MGKRIDLAGKKFGRLLVLAFAGRAPSGPALWLCRCDCGVEKNVRGSHLLQDPPTLSCGCWRREQYHKAFFKHGKTYSPEHKAYVGARNRCRNPKNAHWKDYGGRGITFGFTSFAQFFAELGPRPTPEHSLDRRDNDGNYEPGNVRWATKSEQAQNRRAPKKENSLAKAA